MIVCFLKQGLKYPRLALNLLSMTLNTILILLSSLKCWNQDRCTPPPPHLIYMVLGSKPNVHARQVLY